ncbi:transposase family protein [Ancylothrix sp. C2]|nr:transposase family protein [Ancylothrix sp. D3o]MCT7952132.1 transposase family protein [Ancylothrix sp. D3o]
MTTFQLLDIQFGISETTANDTFNYGLPQKSRITTM